MFEEEDFDPRDYGYVLTPDIVNTKACFMLKEAEDELTKQSKANPDKTEVRIRIGTHTKWRTSIFILFFRIVVVNRGFKQ